MKTRLVKVTDKGQISLPVTIRRSLNIDRGDELIMVQTGNSITMKKIKKSDFTDLIAHSEKVAEKLWRNKEDDIWDTV